MKKEVNDLTKLMLLEKQVKFINDWNDHVDMIVDQLYKNTSFCYHQLLYEKSQKFYKKFDGINQMYSN